MTGNQLAEKANIRVVPVDGADLLHLVDTIQQGRTVDRKALAGALQKHAGKPIPSEIAMYVASILCGQGRKGRPRKNLWQAALERRFNWFYPKILEALQAYHKDRGRFIGLGSENGSEKFHDVPTHELAARLTLRHMGFRGTDNWRTYRNKYSSQK